MKVAPGGQHQPVTDEPLHLAVQFAYAVVVEPIFGARMGRGHNMGHAIVDRRLRHRQRFLDVGRPVIYARQDVAMHVDHSRIL